MSPITHFLTGWLTANVGQLENRDRVIVAMSAVVPDIDGLGILAGIVSNDREAGLHLYGQFHHVLAHNLFAGLLLMAIAWALSKKKWLTASLAFAVFHLHLLQDFISGRGPDGAIWPISYLFPAHPDFMVGWSGQWELNAWPNIAISTLLLFVTFYLAWKRGYSPVGIVSARADKVFINTLRARFH